MSTVSRRAALLSVAAPLAAGLAPSPAHAASDDPVAPKRTGLTDEELLEAIRKDFVDGQYYVNGNLTRAIYREDCVFKDPSVKTVGPGPYSAAVPVIFLPEESRADLISIEVESPRVILLRWRLEGKLRNGLQIKPYTGFTRYYIDDDGLIYNHVEGWDTSLVDVFVSCFVPSFGVPPAPPAEELRQKLDETGKVAWF
ncbi:unnamed protein product [Pedinophyceae sp. YPF-701]|nr:unnamed protein product [Pedinophyceae sp. YPF-701]